LLAVVFSGLALLLEGRLGLNLADEGFLWEGVEKVRRGLVPCRDFTSYEPGRYYWCLAGTYFFGPGIMAIRISAALFGALGLTCGLYAAARVLQNRLALTALAAVLCLWMIPRWKTFDYAVSLMVLWALTRLAERWDWKNLFVTGLLTGLTAIIGRNHGLYALAASAGLLSLLAWKRMELRCGRTVLAWGAGFAVGWLPLAAFCLCVPGFWDACLDGVRQLIALGQTNLPLPVPWPWRQLPQDLPRSLYLATRASGWAFFLGPVICAVLAVRALRTPGERLQMHALAIAAAFVAPVYLHHAFARAHPLHLAQALAPTLLGFIALSAAFSLRLTRSLTLPALLGFSAVATAYFHPLGQRLVELRNGIRWQSYAVAGERLRLPPYEIAHLKQIRNFVARYCEPGEAILVVTEPTLYPFLGRTCPVANAFPLLPASESSQHRMLADLKRHTVRVALIRDNGVDDRPELRFSRTHALVWEALNRSYQRLPSADVPGGFQAFLATDSDGTAETSSATQLRK
jgi:hypothetical protein